MGNVTVAFYARAKTGLWGWLVWELLVYGRAPSPVPAWAKPGRFDQISGHKERGRGIFRRPRPQNKILIGFSDTTKEPKLHQETST
jgi:hypothetical protein